MPGNFYLDFMIITMIAVYIVLISKELTKYSILKILRPLNKFIKYYDIMPGEVSFDKKCNYFLERIDKLYETCNEIIHNMEFQWFSL